MFWAHFRQSIRALGREPGFTAFAVLTLALGIGASTAMFSVFNGVLLAPVPFTDPHRVVAINTRYTNTGRQTDRISGGDYVDLAAARDIFDAVGRYHGGEVGVQLRNRAEWADSYWVSPEFFRVFNVSPIAGRPFNASEAERSAVVSASFADRSLGGPGKAIGQVIHIDTHPYEIVGVMPEPFHFPAKGEIWVAGPEMPENRNRTAFNYHAVARLKAGVTPGAATTRLEALGRQLEAAYPGENHAKVFAAVPVRDNEVRDVRSTVVLLMAAVVVLLLISCANVAHLLLARAARRSREFAVRAALGAGAHRIVAQMLIESLALGLGGGAAGILTAYAGVRAVQWLAPENLPRIGDVRIDWTVLAFGIAVAVVSSVLFGLAPAWQALRNDVQDGLRASSGRGVVGTRSARLRNTLVACEIALSFALAVGAGLLVRSFVELNAVALGFRTENILVTYAHSPANTMPRMLASTRFFEQALAEIDRLPGVKSSAAAMGLPAGRYGSNGGYGIDGMDVQQADLNSMPYAVFSLASPHYFETMGIPLLRGRDFTGRDQYDQPFVVIISESVAKKSFPNQDPIGHKIICGLDSDKWMTVVGEVADVHSDGPGQAAGPELYMPFQQHPIMANELEVAVRTTASAEAMTNTVEQKIRSLNPEIALKTTTMKALISDSIATPRFRTFLVATFAGVALLLAMAGVYGVMSYLVTQRTPELGLRMALGSSASGVVGLVLSRAGVLAGIGLAGGIAVALLTSRLISSLLFGVKSTDVFGYAAAAGAIAVITLMAAAVPAWRAARIDPAIALREE
jgi:predicted permease